MTGSGGCHIGSKSFQMPYCCPPGAKYGVRSHFEGDFPLERSSYRSKLEIRGRERVQTWSPGLANIVPEF